MIRRRIDKARQLTFHLCEGKISVEELATEIRAPYQEEPTPDHLWDLSAADVSAIGSQELDQLAKIAKIADSSGAGRKTAIVTPTDLGFGLSRMYQVFVEMAGLRVKVGVFRTRKEAEDWFVEEVKKE